MPEATFSTPLLALDAVVLDTETTGLDPRKARLLQIGAVRIQRGNLDADQRFVKLINPGALIPKASVAVHGITDAMVADAPKFPAVIQDFEAFVGNSFVIGHAIAYDLTVLQREYSLAGQSWPNIRGLDVRLLARIAAPSLADHGLDRLCAWLGIEIVDRHSALGDAIATAKVFLALLPLLRSRNVRTLAEADVASRMLAEQEALSPGASPSSFTEAPQALKTLLRVDSFPYRHLVRDVMSKPAVFAPLDATVQAVVRLMVEKRVSSVFVRAASGEIGIVTERDILRVVDAGGEAAPSMPVSSVMRSPLQTVPEDAFVYRAIGRMDRLGFRHLGVSNRTGEIVGAVTTRNLLRHRATTAVVLGDKIDSASTPAELAAAWANLPVMVRNLMQEDVDPRTMAGVVSSEICSMTRRAAELAEEQLRTMGLGAPPVAYAVLVLGSAGRGESQLAADQDNAIVYASGAEGGAEDAYFEKLATHMSDVLDASGIPYCKGGVMAKNKAWRKSVSAWRATIDGWVQRQRPEDLLNVDIFFDAVPVHGEVALGEVVWNHAYHRGHLARAFQNLLIEVTRNRTSPFTLLGSFRLDSRRRLDLKRVGLMPIFSAARVLSIRHDIRARSSVERFNGFVAKEIGLSDSVQSVLDAHRVLLKTVIAQQLVDTESGVPLSTHVEIGRLDKAARAQLKQAVKAVAGAIDLVSEGRV